MLIKYKPFWFFQNYIYFIFITDFASRTVTIWLILIAWPDSPKPEGPPSLTCWVSLSEVSSFFNHKHKYRNTSASGALSILIRTVSSKWQEESGNGSFWDEIWYQVRQWQIVHHRWGWTMIWRGDEHHGTNDAIYCRYPPEYFFTLWSVHSLCPGHRDNATCISSLINRVTKSKYVSSLSWPALWSHYSYSSCSFDLQLFGILSPDQGFPKLTLRR